MIAARVIRISAPGEWAAAAKATSCHGAPQSLSRLAHQPGRASAECAGPGSQSFLFTSRRCCHTALSGPAFGRARRLESRQS